MPAARGFSFRRWFECSKCGFDYPIDQVVRQNGQLRCTVIPCRDAPSRGDYLAEHDIETEELQEPDDSDLFTI